MTFLDYARLLMLLIFIGGIACIAWNIFVNPPGRNFEQEAQLSPGKGLRKLGSALVVVGLVGAFWLFTCAKYIANNEVGVVQNTATGRLSKLSSGTHIWPFESKISPFSNKITVYSLQSKSYEIGKGNPTNKNGIQSGSKSPGNPTVYFYVRVQANPDPNKILELHTKFEDGYEEWLKQQSESAIKTVQGEQELDYLVQNRGAFELALRTEIERRLKLETGTTGDSWIHVSQATVIDYDYDDRINAQLQDVLSKELEARKAEQNNRTLETNAKGQATATAIAAKTDAEQKTTIANAEATAIAVVQNALSTSPAYVDLETVKKWNGNLPQITGGAVPFVNVPNVSGTPTPTATPVNR